jgi:beta-glucosidase
MSVKTARVAVVILLAAVTTSIAQQYEFPFQNPNLPLEQRADNIVSLMTLEEKIAAFANPAVKRLNIPGFGSAEGIHQAVLRAGPAGGMRIPTTSFSQVYGMGETWDPELIQRAGAVIGYEARYATQNEKYRRPTLVLWGPTSDLARDPRWGRNDESYSEDPFLAGTMATALAKGIQGDDPRYWQAAALLKHFFANSNETNRGGSSSNFDMRLMREYYSVPFRMVFLGAGVRSFMASYNAWNGVPMTVNPVLKDTVAKEWGANWIVSSDAGAMRNVVTLHKYLKTEEEVTAAAIKVGLNQFLRGGSAESIKQALDDKQLTESDIDAAIKGKYKTILKLGLLDPPSMSPYSKIGTAGEPEPWNTEKDKTVAREVARESIVLLKNATGLLPLDRKRLKSIAVVGPRAAEVLSDLYTGPMPYAVSVLQGIRDKAGAGITVNSAANNDDGAAVNAARSSDVAVVVVGNHPVCGADLKDVGQIFNPQDSSTKPCSVPGEGREGRDRLSIDLPSEELVRQVYAVNPKTIVVLVSSFPYAINWSQANVPAILHITHAAQEQGAAIADALFGDYNPGGRLVQTWPKSLDQLPQIEDYDLRHGRTYLYFRGEPLYPFGYGLSYTTFAYSSLRLSSPNISKNGAINVSVQVKNAGKRAGEEVIQLYVRYPKSAVERPLKELKGFQRVRLAAGEAKTVRIPLNAASLAWWNEAQRGWEVESGPVEIMIGSSSAEIALHAVATLGK